MFKKMILNIIAMLGLSLMQLTNVMADFDDMETIKSWVAVQYHSDEHLMQRIQDKVRVMLSRNPQFIAENSTNFITNGIDYGRPMPTGVAIELLCLQYTHERSKEVSPMYTAEWGSGDAGFSWKVPLTFEGEGWHFANDINEDVMSSRDGKDFKKGDGLFKQKIKSFLTVKKLRKTIQTVPGDCLQVFGEGTSWKERFHVVFTGNLFHFFNPEQVNRSMAVLDHILAPKGRAYIFANSCPFKKRNPSDPLFSFYEKQKAAGDRFPCFVKYRIEVFEQRDSGKTCYGQVSDIERPGDSVKFNKRQIGETTYGFTQDPSTQQWLLTAKGDIEIISNGFSPEIFRKIVEQHKSLRVVDAFYMNDDGLRKDEWDEDVKRAAVIIEKV